VSPDDVLEPRFWIASVKPTTGQETSERGEIGVTQIGRRFSTCIYLRNAHREVAKGEMSMVSLYAYAGGRSALSLMTVNRNLEAAWKYHSATKHSYASVHNNLHSLDWENKPLPFKDYTALYSLPLPREVRQSGVAALSAVAESIQSEAVAVPDLEALAQLLYLTAGITRHRKHPGGDIWFRRSLHRSTLRSRGLRCAR